MHRTLRPSRSARRMLLPLALVAVSGTALVACGDLPASGFAAPSDSTTAGGYSSEVQREVLLEAAERTVLDQLVEYPHDSQAQITASIVTMDPGVETGWHGHGAPLVVYVLEGAVTVTYQTDTGDVTKTYSAGESIVEAVGTVHNGANLGDVPVTLYVVNIGADGVENTFKV